MPTPPSFESVIITHDDERWHEAFLRFVPRIFPEISFRRWVEYGGWNERYRAFALVDGDRLVANASLERMELVRSGRRMRAWQLGAVGTEPALRSQGLQRRIMQRVFQEVPDGEPVFLFANQEVLGFYPRFGFRPVRERIFSAHVQVTPQPCSLRRLDCANVDDRALLQRVASTALPVTARFGAADYGLIVLWYWCNFYPEGLWYAADADAVFVLERRPDNVLHIADVLSARPIDLRSYLPELVTSPNPRVEFGFTPELLWPEAEPTADYTEGVLFVRGADDLPDEPFKFPLLAQT